MMKIGMEHCLIKPIMAIIEFEKDSSMSGCWPPDIYPPSVSGWGVVNVKVILSIEGIE